MPTPTLGLHLIVGGSSFQAQQLADLLASWRPALLDQMVVVDTGAPGAQEICEAESAIRVADGLTPIEVHPFTWVNDFAKARNYALSFLHTDIILWADADDVIEGADKLRGLIARQSANIGGIWCPYVYSTDEYGNVTTVHDKERILWAREGWRWEGRLHETLVPTRSVHWAREEDVVWVHHSEAGSKSDRNMPILMDWLKDEPKNIRIWMFIGNQHFADGNFAEAARWYTRFWTYNDGQLTGTPTDRWIAMMYGARAWRELGNFHEAQRADLAAIQLFPGWADGYIGMAESMMLTKNWQRAIEWGEIAAKKGPADRIAFVNPLDYTWRLWHILNVCYAAVGRVEHAIEACELALAVRPNDADTLSNKALYETMLPKVKQAEAYAEATKNGGALEVLPYLPEDVKQLERAREVWVPARIERRGTQPKLAIFCGETLEEWDATTPLTKGIGGSETAVVEVANRLAQKGWEVTVYNACGNKEGDYDGVFYANWPRFRPDLFHDVTVSWRHPQFTRERPNAKETWLWMHDLNHGDRLTADWAQGFDRVLGVSEWHRDYLKRVYPFLGDKAGYLPNGIDLMRFQQPHGPKNRFRVVYCSSPDRGLGNLLVLWPHIRKVEPTAELHVFYGWENFQESIRRGQLHYRSIMENILALGKQPGVVWRGRVNQRELAKEMLEADLWLYPTAFLETFCITALEAQAANLKIVASRCGNLPNIIGDAGVTVPGQATSTSYKHGFLGATYAMLMDMETRLTYHGRGPARVQDWTWDKSVEQWMQLMTVKELARV